MSISYFIGSELLSNGYSIYTFQKALLQNPYVVELEGDQPTRSSERKCPGDDSSLAPHTAEVMIRIRKGSHLQVALNAEPPKLAFIPSISTLTSPYIVSKTALLYFLKLSNPRLNSRQDSTQRDTLAYTPFFCLE